MLLIPSAIVSSYQAQILVLENTHGNERIIDIQLPEHKRNHKNGAQNDQGDDVSGPPSLGSGASNTKVIVSEPQDLAVN